MDGVLVSVKWGPGVVEAVVADSDRLVACRIDAGGRWHCECAPGLYRPRADECCRHLYALGSMPARRTES